MNSTSFYFHPKRRNVKGREKPKDLYTGIKYDPTKPRIRPLKSAPSAVLALVPLTQDRTVGPLHLLSFLPPQPWFKPTTDVWTEQNLLAAMPLGSPRPVPRPSSGAQMTLVKYKSLPPPQLLNCWGPCSACECNTSSSPGPAQCDPCLFVGASSALGAVLSTCLTVNQATLTARLSGGTNSILQNR